MYTREDVERILQREKVDNTGIGYDQLIETVLLILGDAGLNGRRRIMEAYKATAQRLGIRDTKVEINIRNLLRRANCKMVAGSFIYYVADTLLLTKSDASKTV